MKIVILHGISGSGKSTYARSLAGTDLVRINRDEIRQMIFGFTEEDSGAYYESDDLFSKETIVSYVEDSILVGFVVSLTDTIIDNTNLKMRYVDNIYSRVNYHTSFGLYGKVEYEHIVFNVDLEEAVRRDNLRSRSVGREVIERQYKQLQSLLVEFESRDIKYRMV